MAATENLRLLPAGPPLPKRIGAYAVVSLLGCGAMGDVFLTVPRDRAKPSKLYTLKCLRADYAYDPIARTTLVAEASLAARFAHPNLVPTLEVGEDESRLPYLVLDYRDGQSLTRLVRSARRARLSLPHEMWALVVARALRGLHWAHELADYSGRALGVVHRDVSPDNIIIGYDGHVSLIDFGIARIAAHLSHSEVGIMKGKIAYMAPEAIDDEGVDRRSDIFSMGVVLWELLAGQSIASFGGGRCAPHFLSSKELPRLRSAVPDVDPRLDAIVARALERDPEERFATARGMREALEAWLARRPTFSDEQTGRWVAHLFQDERRTLDDKVVRALAAR